MRSREVIPAKSRELDAIGYSDELHSRWKGGSRVERDDSERGWDGWFERNVKVFGSCDGESDATFVKSLQSSSRKEKR